MNAMAGDNPEAAPLTEVTNGKAQEPAEASPMRIRHRQRCGEGRLTGAIKGLPLWGENGHECKCSQCSARLSLLPLVARNRPQLPDELDHRRADGNKDDRRQNEDD